MDKMNKGLHELCLPLYTRRSEYPIDNNFLYWNCIFTCALYLKIKGIELNKILISSLFWEEGSFENIKWFYETLGSDPINRYACAVISLLAKAAAKKASSCFVKTPAVSSIRDLVNVSLNDTKETKTPDYAKA
ncbi:MAG: hypothetical protein MJ239_05140 [Bacilli bacterium]|nr:hypothetical protein [Bacilli bacterium]